MSNHNLSRAGTYRSLQDRVVEWHTKKFPTSTAERQTLKAGEELGELMAAVLSPNRPGVGEAPAEAADVLICLFAIIGRNYPGHNVLVEVEKKLAILNDPNSGHRSSLPKES